MCRLDWHKMAACLSMLGCVIACSNGRLDTRDRDYYQSVFGLSLTSDIAMTSSVVGRVVDKSGKALVGAQIFVGNQPYGLTNQKGGFYVPYLAEGSHSLIVIGANSQGLTHHLELKDSVPILLESLTITDTVTLSGKITLENDDMFEGSVAYIEDSPFYTLTDRDGSYHFSLPKGRYRLRVSPRLPIYLPQQSNTFELVSDMALDMELLEAGFPDAEVLLAPGPDLVVENGYRIVKGRTVRFAIKPKSPLRLMRILLDSGSVSVRETAPINHWVRFTEELEIEHPSAGLHSLSFEFQDGLGRTSEPVPISYFVVDRTADVRFLVGEYDQPVTIAPHSTVAILSSDFGLGLRTEIHPRVLDTWHPSSGNHRAEAEEFTSLGDLTSDVTATTTTSSSVEAASSETSAAVITSSYVTTLFREGVDIGAGTQIIGGAGFNGGLRASGSKEHPIQWDLSGSSIELGLDSQSHVRYVELKGGRVLLNGGTHSVIEDSSFEGTILSQSLTDLAREKTSFAISNSNLHFSTLKLDCYSVGDPGSTSESATPSFRFTLSDSMVSETQVRLSCYHWLIQEPVRGDDVVNIVGNYFSDVTIHSHYFGTGMRALAEMVSAGESLPITFEATNNYFQNPTRLYPGVQERGWPSFVDPSVALVPEGVGIR